MLFNANVNYHKINFLFLLLLLGWRCSKRQNIFNLVFSVKAILLYKHSLFLRNFTEFPKFWESVKKLLSKGRTNKKSHFLRKSYFLIFFSCDWYLSQEYGKYHDFSSILAVSYSLPPPLPFFSHMQTPAYFFPYSRENFKKRARTRRAKTHFTNSRSAFIHSWKRCRYATASEW